MADAERDVCVASGGGSREEETVLVVGFDSRPASSEALRVAVGLAGRLSARVEVVHGVSLNDYPIDPDSGDWEEQAQQVLADDRAEVEHLLAGHDFGWSYRAAHGDPVDMLVRSAQASNALMIVVGTRGEGLRSSFERLLDRSVSHGVVEAGDWPVLVVPGPA